MNDVFINRMLSAPRGVASRARIFFYRQFGMKVGERCWLRAISVPRNPWDIALAEGVALDDGVVLLTSGCRQDTPRLRLGARVYVNRYTVFDVSEHVTVGPDCMIGPHVYITDHDHGTEPGQRLSEQPLIGAPVKIGRNVWIGAGAIILKGVTLGDNSVIGAGAVITKDVPSGALVTGVPGRPRKLVYK